MFKKSYHISNENETGVGVAYIFMKKKKLQIDS